VEVQPDQLYSTQPLYVGYKGVRYFAGPVTPELDLPNPTQHEMDEFRG
jgi:hypothetical protein